MTAVPGIDLPAAQAHFGAVLGCDPSSISFSLIAGGRSNLTYLMSAGGRDLVLRRPPLGHVLPSAHDMGREYRVISALYGTAVRVPEPIAAAGADNPLGWPYFVMARVAGSVVSNAAAARELTPDQARRASVSLVEQLVAIHTVDLDAIGLADLGRPAGFMARQVKRWLEQWRASGGVETGLPMERLGAGVLESLPPTASTGLVHGDYRLDNTILAADDPGRVAAVIDWEMATLGDPLADLGVFATYWDPVTEPLTGGGHAMDANPGFPDTATLLRMYEDACGRSLGPISPYVAFGHFKLAAIAQTIAARHDQGLTVGEQFAAAAGVVPELVHGGLAVLAAGES
ncbi:MAG: phosphotransferase family protein [Actinomycetota bacterium]|nr:MAG: phosphotransferase family protein [Actinomycetota bacterium]